MRGLALLVLLSLTAAACAPTHRLPPPPAPQERRVAGAARPLPRLVVEARGAAADGQRQDLDGAAGGAANGARYGAAGHHLFGRRGLPRTEQLGVQERDAPERINDYWKSVGRPEPQRPRYRRAVVGGVHLVGHRERRRAARPLLPRRTPHDLCRAHGRARTRRPGAAFMPRHAERARAAGRRPDLRLARGRRHHAGQPQSRTPDIATSWSRCGPAKCTPSAATWRDSVSRSVFPLDANGFLSPISGRPFSP